MSQEGIRQVGDVIIEPVLIEKMTPSEILEYCEGLDDQSELYVEQITQALAVAMQLFIHNSRQIKSGNFPNYSIWNVASNYYSAVEHIQDMIHMHMSQIQSEI